MAEITNCIKLIVAKIKHKQKTKTIGTPTDIRVMNTRLQIVPHTLAHGPHEPPPGQL